MAELIVLPKLGLTMEDGKVSAWLAGEGDEVRAGQAVVEVETYKATVEVESPIDGVLLAALPPGTVAPAGATIGVVGAPGEDAAGLLWEGDGNGTRVAVRTPPPDLPTPSQQRVIASPVARKRAVELGIDLGTVHGTGPGGRIQLSDLEVATERVGSPVASPDQSAPTTAGGASPGSALNRTDPTSRELPMTPMRRAIAASMSASAAIPQFTADAEVDCSVLMHLQEALRGVGVSLSISDVLTAAVARSLSAHPALTRVFTDTGLIRHEEISIGIAVAIDDGLLVPVIHDAGSRSLAGIAAERRRLTKAAHAGRLSERDMTGGVFTISNLGPLGLRRFRALVHPGEAAILAVGAVTDRPFAVEGALVVRPGLSLSISCDHRSVDGAHAARFMGYLVEAIEQPSWLGDALIDAPQS
ncbi:MAG: hypothetical protein QOJ13_2774 [Gaiellales bacterium]|jgi:pyruvate dehydrogenase E2 component (dihydrolipoamide acetyltransferase)|nr:hypothetical protein [Gaiellales bacterium]